MLGGLVGMAAADVAFVESAQAALVALLTGWRLPAGSRVACLPGRVRAERRPAARLRPAPRAAAGRRPRPGRRRGRRAAARRRPAVLRAPDPHPAATAALLQPAAEIAALCREAGVPLVLDAAQSLGHADTDLGADVVYGTSRKWLAGPRGVGVLCVRPALAAQLTPVLPEPEGVPPMRAFESGEAHVAGRVGLVVAVGEHLAAGPDRVRERLGGDRPGHPGAARRRRRLAGRSSRSTSRRPPRRCARRTASTSSTPARRLLTEHGIVVSAIGPERAPGRDDRPGAARLPAPGRHHRRPRGPRRRPLSEPFGTESYVRQLSVQAGTGDCMRGGHPAVDGELLVQARVHRDAVLHDEPAADDGVPRGHRPAAQPRLHRVRQRAGERGRRRAATRPGRRRRPTDSSPISPARPRQAAPPRVAISRASRADIDARAVPELALQHRRPGLQPQRRGVRRRRAVHAQPDRRARPPAARRPATARCPGSCWTTGSAPPHPRRAQPGHLVRRSARRRAPATPGRSSSRRRRGSRPAAGRTSPGRTRPRPASRTGGCAAGRRAARPAPRSGSSATSRR